MEISKKADRLSDVTEYSSLSNFKNICVSHIDLDWFIDFESNVLSGTATLTVEAVEGSVEKVVLDTRDLAIESVTVDGVEAKYKLLEAHEVFGSALSIDLPQALSGNGLKASVAVTYKTSPDSSAMQWLPPAQTAGKVKPYLFTQCQAIHARSIVPCFDAPGCKASYSARVTAPAWATVLMSALQGDVAKEATVGDTRVKIFTWNQPIPCSSYLIALAVGDLESRDISDRCRVWSEPSMVEAVRFEFDQTETFLKVAEDLAGPYRWTRYDVLCLPPSFPFGGMENPCLTFVTPTLLAGDKSLAGVVAHEIAHSWTGNLVTNATWTHFWLNEGWTRWFELTIMARIMGDDRFFDIKASLGMESLRADVERYGLDNELTCLLPPLEGIDPDDSFSSVPYERGMNLLLYLQRKVGKEPFLRFFRAYVEEFASKTVYTAAFQAFFAEHFPAEAETVEWNLWFLAPGMPPVELQFDLTLVEPVKALAKAWIKASDDKKGRTVVKPALAADYLGWPSLQQQLFLQELFDKGKVLSIAALDAIEEAYKLDTQKNSEIRFKWIKLCLRAGRAAIMSNACEMAITQGRMKFVRPLYRFLVTCPIAGASRAARSLFEANKDVYHPICRKMVANDLAKTEVGDADVDGAPPKRSMATRVFFGAGVVVALAVASFW